MRLGRRSFLAGSGAVALLTLTRQLPLSPFAARLRFADDPFALGIASGDPLPDSVVLWTRLLPTEPDADWVGADVPVEWLIAEDEGLSRVAQRGVATASPRLGHAVHVDVRGLQPDRPYWYGFRAGSHTSPVGRTRTAPPADAEVARLRLAVVSCQHWEQGYYTAYRHLATDNPDVVLHLGDYIYEGPPTNNRPRRHDSPPPYTLAEYRARYALYKSDPDLQAAHAGAPWVVTPDDHEVENNYAGTTDGRGGSGAAFLARRAAAYQAYYEHMPLRAASIPDGPDMLLYRRLRWGRLAEFAVLDTRQYRTDQPCGDGLKALCAEALDESATLTGPEQEQWLIDGLAASDARWNVVAQQVMMAPVDMIPGPEEAFFLDQWAGYVAARDRLLGFIAEQRPTNPVILSGDIHSTWINDLRRDFADPASAVVATEFVGTSISSGGDGFDTNARIAAITRENPHVRFTNHQRGYLCCDLTPRTWQTDVRVLPTVSARNAAITTRATFVVESGQPGAQQG